MIQSKLVQAPSLQVRETMKYKFNPLSLGAYQIVNTTSYSRCTQLRVAAVYRQDNKLYIGEVLEVDEDDVLVSSLEHRDEITPKSVSKTSKRLDEVWVAIKDILSIVLQPEKKGIH